MSKPKFETEVPGRHPVLETRGPYVDDATAALLAEKDATIAQQTAMIADLNAKLEKLATVPATVASPKAVRTIGEDWSSKTSAEAQAAGVTHTVKCSDGYYVP